MFKIGRARVQSRRLGRRYRTVVTNEFGRKVFAGGDTITRTASARKAATIAYGSGIVSPSPGDAGGGFTAGGGVPQFPVLYEN